MKINDDVKIESCYDCQDCKPKPDGFFTMDNECLKFGHKAQYLPRLFEKCRLPEVKEIKVWFEKEPAEAEVFDLCVYDYCLSYNISNLTGHPWVVDRKDIDGSWIQIMDFRSKEQAEAFLGCKIPEMEINK